MKQEEIEVKRRLIQNSSVLAATDEKSDGYNEAYDNLKDNFDYAMDGFEKLSRDGKEGERTAIQYMLELNAAIEAAIGHIAGTITKQ